MPKIFISAGSFLATVNPHERKMIIDAQEKVRSERNIGGAPFETIELPLVWCQEAIALHRSGHVTTKNLGDVLQ